MQNVILVIHILAALAMTGLVLLQKSEGGGLGIGGGGSNSLMSGRGAAGALVRSTMIFGAVFFVTSLTLTSIANRSFDNRSDIERAIEGAAPAAAPTGPIDLLDPTVPLLNEAPVTSSEVGIAPAQTPPAGTEAEAPADSDAVTGEAPVSEEPADAPVNPQ